MVNSPSTADRKREWGHTKGKVAKAGVQNDLRVERLQLSGREEPGLSHRVDIRGGLELLPDTRVHGGIRGGTHCRRLEDGALKGRNTVAATVRSQVRVNAAGAGRLAKDGDGVGVTTKLVDVLLDPVECEALVQQTGIGGDVEVKGTFGREAEETTALWSANEKRHWE